MFSPLMRFCRGSDIILWQVFLQPAPFLRSSGGWKLSEEKKSRSALSKKVAAIKSKYYPSYRLRCWHSLTSASLLLLHSKLESYCYWPGNISCVTVSLADLFSYQVLLDMMENMLKRSQFCTEFYNFNKSLSVYSSWEEWPICGRGG